MTDAAAEVRQFSGRRFGSRLVPVILASALTAMGLVAGQTAASADTGDGTVTVRVVQEVNANGVVDDTLIEPPLIGVTVHLTDADGNTISATTGDDGVATFDPSTSDLAGGQYRVDVDNPRPGTYFPGHAANDQTAFHVSDSSLPIDLSDPDNTKLSSTTEFVDVADGADAYVNTSFWYPAYYCQENATVCGAALPNSVPGRSTAPDDPTLFTVPYHVNEAPTQMSTVADTGALYGIAWDSDSRQIFSSAVAHRASEYGPGGPGAIYATSESGGDTTLWATVPNAGTDTHDMADHSDYGFYDQVGKTSLGELEITNDNHYLFVTNLNDQKVYVYDATQAGGPNTQPLSSTPIPNPCSVASDWRPFGEGVGLDTSYVGGVCSAESTQDPSDMKAVIYEFDPATGVFGDIVLDQPLDYGRGLAFPDGSTCTGGAAGAERLPNEGHWWPWRSTYPSGPNLETTNANGCYGWTSYPEPILVDIIEDTNGDLVIGFRDRFTDQVSIGSFFPNADGTSWSTNVQPASGGDIVRGCKLTDGTFVLDPNYAGQTLAAGSVCTDNNVAGVDTHGQPTTFREYYSGDWTTGSHQETFYSGQALSRGEGTIVSDVADPNGIWTAGVGATGRDGSRHAGGVTLPQASQSFAKGGGLADMEVLCDKAPVQIGNRVWIDSDGDGSQDAGEPAVPGATVNLYDADGNLVATTTTDANGNYFFDDTNVDGGLDQNTDYVVKMDNPDDYAVGGPLDGFVPTVANAGDDDSLDSDGVVPAGGDYPQIDVTTGDAGQDDHSNDFGFIQHTPAVDIEKYDTIGGATEGDADTVADAVAYTPGEARTINFDVSNTGTDALSNVVVNDTTNVGQFVTNMSCTFPGHNSPTAGSRSGGFWTVTWAETQGDSPTETWAPGVTFGCTATLTLAGDAPPHADTAMVTGTSVDTGATVTDQDAYHAFTGDVQLVKYDGRGDFTPTQDANGIPEKPLIDGSEKDANTADTAVTYTVPTGADATGPFPVSWAVTNTGTTYLGAVSIGDNTLNGPDLADISCDFSPLGGPASGTTWDGPWAPGDTFYCTGNLTLDATGDNSTHGDTATVDATVIHPAPNPDYTGLPDSNPYLDEPELDTNGNPVLSDQDLADDDDYHADVAVPSASIDKGDGDAAGATINHDADTMADGQAYQPGETRDIVFTVTNNGDTPLHDVTVTDALLSGDTAVQAMSCTFPGDSDPTAGNLDGTTWTVAWAASFDVPDGVAWQPGASFDCTATLTLNGTDAPHVDLASVTTTLSPQGSADNPPAQPDGPTADNPYNAFTGDVQVIKYDGNEADPAVGSGPTSWTPPAKPLTDANQDANDAAHAVDYPAGQPQPVRWVVTNTGATWLTDITLSDTTGHGPDIGAWTCDLTPVGGPADYSFTDDGPWTGPLAPGASFFCQGPLTLDEQQTHADTVDVAGTVVQPVYDDNGQPVVDQNGVPEYATDNDGNPVATDVTPTDNDMFHAQTPEVTIVKGDGADGEIVHDADTPADGATYDPAGETRTIISVATNSSVVPLHDVALTDHTTAGDAPTALSCTFPDGSTADGSFDTVTSTWTVRWDATFVPGTTTWAPGDVISCTSTLSMTGSSAPHRDEAGVTAVTPAGTTLADNNPYNAFTGDIQVIKYDGNEADPAVGAGPTSWTPPAKPLTDPAQDANDAAHAVDYPAGQAQPVRWVVTNTGATWLTNVTLSDSTTDGPDVGAWTCDLTPVGGDAGYSFSKSGPWAGPLAPGASFFCEGPLTLQADQTHADTVDVAGTVVQPVLGDNGQPVVDQNGVPEYATDNDGNPVATDLVPTDQDAFHAQAPTVSIVKGDGTDGAITHDANSMTHGASYEPAGEARTIVTIASNPSTVALHAVAITDVTSTGDAPVAMSCAFPDGSSADGTFDTASKTWTVRWEATFDPGTATWAPGTDITCTSTLSMTGSSQPHRDVADVAAITPAGTVLTDDNPYNAFTGDIQVIKYDGNKADPAVGSGPTSWTPPAKPLADSGQDANDAAHAVDYPAGQPQPVRWVVTNTGATWLTDIALSDTTGHGPDVTTWICDLTPVGGPASYSFATPWPGPLAPGASFFCQGSLTLASGQTHADTVDVTGTVVAPLLDENGKPVLDDDGVPEYATSKNGTPVPSDLKPTDEDAFHADAPAVSIVKGDGTDGEIAHDADTPADGVSYDSAGETRTVISIATNDSADPLHDVTISDATSNGDVPTGMSCTFPDGSTAKGSFDAGTKTWTVTWQATFAPGTATWNPGTDITCTSQLHLDGTSQPHRDVAGVTAVTPAGTTVTDDNPYHAFSGDIQVIKYDGTKDDPAVGSGSDAWSTPVKPLGDTGQDANDAAHAVAYPSGKAQPVRWVVTNTGQTWLTDVVVTDITDSGPGIDPTTVTCTFPDGTTAGVVDGTVTWTNPDGVLFAPGASFFCQGMLTLQAGESHGDTANASATVVPPRPGEGGVLTDGPLLDQNGQPVRATAPDSSEPFTVSDADSFHASSAAQEGLSYTGFDTLGALTGAVLLLFGGAVLLLAGYRRKWAVR